MKLPSLQQITEASLRSLGRFPFVLTVATAGTIAAIMTVEAEANGEMTSAFRVLFAALTGVPFLIGLKLLAEKRSWSTAVDVSVQICALLLLAAYAWSLPAYIPAAPAVHVIRLLLIVAGMHLFVAAAPWTGRGTINGFWHYNKILFLRLLTAALFAHVLYAGLAIALAAVENLFELEVPGERYAQLWMLLAGMFMTWFFLAGMPSDLDVLDKEEDYPKGLKVFSQYVLFPLVLIYLVILVAYSGKIIIAWNWPYGWVSRLILGYSAVGLFSLLLLHPIRERAENKWIIFASRLFFISLLPLLVMYFLAVLQRLSDYGLTESRYIGIVIGVWLTVITLYFLFSRGKNIKSIPITLCLLAFAISVGPWGAFAVSENSQVTRLKGMLEKNSMFEGEKIRKAAAEVSPDDIREISAVLQYLHEIHGFAAIGDWFEESLRHIPSQETQPIGQSEWKAPSDVAKMMGLEYVAGRMAAPGGRVTYRASLDDIMIIAGYDAALPQHSFDLENTERSVSLDDVSFHLNPSLDTLTFIHEPEAEVADTLVLPLRPVT
ncbi:MAG: DUF4153 domain-containing protein, partial [Bacteroidetes bacterium]|nr:DUF4153 domain-containing protein [Bacteroidota bacterium]